MRTTGLLFLSLILLGTWFGIATAEDRDGGGALDQGGVYCGAAVLIPANSTDYIDTGYLDGDNDCSSPFGWPYNDIFYRFTPPSTGLYIFRLQLGWPSTNVALRVMSGACCSGGTSEVAINDPMVAADCDTGRTVYLRDTLYANVNYWFHIGDNSIISHTSHYRFEMMRIECPATDNDVEHRTCETALNVALNDSIYADSSTAANPDWFKFTLFEPMVVTITELGRAFGHCMTGYYPLCFDNPLDAHFYVYCSCDVANPAVLLDEGHGELCSTDAQSVLCLPGSEGGTTYYIKVANYGGNSWPGWGYVLGIQAVPAPTACAPLPTECNPDTTGNPCPPGDETAVVTLIPDNPSFPDSQHVSMCAKLAFGLTTQIIVPVYNISNIPVISIASGCENCATPCAGGFPAEAWIYNPNGWVFEAIPTGGFPARYRNTIELDPSATGCCVCISLDYILPVELNSFSATSADGQIGLNWVTASETSNDHFEVARDGARVAVVNGAGTSAVQHSYHWTDAAVDNYRSYVYTLTAVDYSGSRHELGTVTAHAAAGVAVITEYALKQNYPNPFNPTTSISFDLVDQGLTSLKVYNLMGQEVATLVNGNLGAGRHTVSFNATTLPSGIYVYRLKVNGFAAENKMLLMK